MEHGNMSDMDRRAGYGSTATGEVATEETHSLISADKVEGTVVYDPQGNRLGSIADVMIDKRSGKVAYAVLSFGGFLGMGSSYYPLPWDQLNYNTNQDGYVVSLTEDQLKGAPSYDTGSSVDWTDRGFTSRIDDYYRSDIAPRDDMGRGRSGGIGSGLV
jgi:sporulation protein YlmC with PRC-barrel domain